MKFQPLLTAALITAAAGVAFAEPATQKPVSLDDCVALALQHSFDIRIQRFAPDLSRLTLSSSYAAYDPSLFMSAGQRFSVSPAAIDPSKPLVPGNENWSDTYQTGITGGLPTGLTYSLSGSVGRSQTALGGANPGDFIYTPGATVSLTQPLLKNLWIDANRLNIALDRLALKSSEEGVRKRVIDTLLSVELAYYDLIYALDQVRVREQALQVSERFLFETRKRVEVGSLAPLDAKQAESEVARNRASLVTARQTLGDRERDLKKLLDDDFGKNADEMLLPTAKLQELPSVQSRSDSWQKAFLLRPDYRQQKLTLEQQRINLRFTRNQLYPQLDLTGAYGVNALETTLGSSLGDLRERRSPTHSWGVRLSFPLDNLAARNANKSAQISQQQLLLTFKQLEQTIMIQVDSDIRAIEGYRQGIEATKEARSYAEAALDAEQKKLESGKSTNYQVLQLQRDLTSAQTDEINALANYNKALAQLAHDEGSTLERLKVNLEIR